MPTPASRIAGCVTGIPWPGSSASSRTPGTLRCCGSTPARAAGSCARVSAATNEACRYLATTAEWGYRMIAAADGAIPVITMPRLLADAGIDEIDVLKCDIESAEAELFAECRRWIERVRTMNVECHHHTIDADGLIGLLDANDAGMSVTRRENHPEFGFDLVALQRNVSS